MGDAPVQDMPDGSVSTRVWQRTDDGPLIIEQHFTHGEDAPFAGYTCDDCPQPHVTTSIAAWGKADYTKRCKRCSRRHAAAKRTRRYGELLLHYQPPNTSIAVLTLTFGDDDIDKYGDPDSLRKATMLRHRKLREKNTFWRENVIGGLSSYETTVKIESCPETGVETRRYHPHLHIVAYVVGKYPYDIEGLREAVVAGGFGPTFRIEDAYTKVPIKDSDGNILKDREGKWICRKDHKDPKGGVFYALKYTRKDSLRPGDEGKNIRTTTRFGCLMGKKWSADMNQQFEEVIRRYSALYGEGRPSTAEELRLREGFVSHLACGRRFK